MPLVTLNDLISDWRRGATDSAIFEGWQSYSLESVLQGAESENASAILGFGCMMLDQSWLDAGGLELAAGDGTRRRATRTVLKEVRTSRGLIHPRDFLK
jgi:hypothetical protein